LQMSEIRILIRLFCYGFIFHGTGNSAQLCQYFGISGGGVLNPQPPPHVRTTLLRSIQYGSWFCRSNLQPPTGGDVPDIRDTKNNGIRDMHGVPAAAHDHLEQDPILSKYDPWSRWLDSVETPSQIRGPE
jgi:hypothetical protein